MKTDDPGDVYEDPTLSEEPNMYRDPWGKWIARICWFALGGTLVNFLAILCVLGWKWVERR